MTSWASDDQKAVAADFITFLHTPEQLTAYYEATGVPPADDRFDPEAITNPLVRQVFDWATVNAAPEIENYVPFDIAFNGFNTAQVQLITGQIESPEEAAAFTQDVADKWRQSNRLLLEQYKQWAAQNGRSGSVGPARAMDVQTDGLWVAGVNEGEAPIPFWIGNSRLATAPWQLHD